MKFLLFCVFMAVINYACSQPPVYKEQQIANDLINLSKKQKKVGWIMFGSGLTIATAGGLIAVDNSLWEFRGPYSGTEEKFNTGVAIIITGAVIAAGSIPFFTMAARNKRRGADVSAQLKIQLENTASFSQGSITTNTFPAMTFKLTF